MSTNSRTYKLYEVVTEASDADEWEEARYEWDVINLSEETDETCICGKKHIVQCHTIRNKTNGTSLWPVGSECVKKFRVDRMEEDAKELKRELHIIEKDKYRVLKNGKHKDMMFSTVCKTQPRYIEWLRTSGFLKEYKDLVAYNDLCVKHA